MRPRFVLSLAAALACATLAVAQPPAPASTEEPENPVATKTEPAPMTTPQPAVGIEQAPDPATGLAPWTVPACNLIDGPPNGRVAGGARFWAYTEYLLWWVKDAPLPVPIATTVLPGVAVPPGQVPGAIGSLGTQVLSPDSLRFGPFQGARVSAGWWFDDERTAGVEISGFLLGTRSAHFAASGTAANGPSVFIPFFSVSPLAPLGESAVPAALVGALNGNVTAQDSVQLWGTEINGLYRIADGDGGALSLVVGGRYLDLAEKLDITSLSSAAGAGAGTLADQSGTHNQFLGANLGARGTIERGNWFASLAGTIALGEMHESVNATGTLSTVSAAGVPTPFAGGFFTQTSNFGRQTHNVFAVVPEVKVQVGYDLTRQLRVFAGYDFLYISDVVRPGEQIDRRLNLTQSSFFGGGTLVGAPLPTPQFNHTDFWAQGVSFGVRLRY